MFPTADKQRAHELIDRMAPFQAEAIVRVMEVMVDPFRAALDNAPYDDEPVSAEEEAELVEIRAALDRGEGIPNEVVLAEFGLTPEDFEEMGRTPLDTTYP